MSTAPGRMHDITQAALAEVAQGAFGWAHRWMPTPRTMAPRAIVASPKPLATGDPDHARQIYRGRFTLAGNKIDTGANSPFQFDAAPPDWRRALASFAWLGDLAAADNELARAQARCLIADWIETRPPKCGSDWAVAILSDRLIAWLTHAPFYLTNAGDAFHHTLMASIGQHVRYLQRVLPSTRAGWPRLHGTAALTQAIVCTEGLEKHLEHAAGLLSRVLLHQILPDGGHISRNPRTAAEALGDLLPLKTAFVDRQIEPPDALLGAIDRLFPFLRTFLHGDKGLAFFNGTSETGRKMVSSLLACDTVRAKPLSFARQTGYARLEHGKTLVIADVGTTRSVRDNDSGHAGALSFEMSHATQRIVVNCGHCAAGPPEWRMATGATAAHSTLTIADRSSARIFRQPAVMRVFGGPLSVGPDTVTAEIQPSEAGDLLAARHDGYVDTFGFIHHREIYLASDGKDLRGEDRLVPAGDRDERACPFAIRFHLHPSIKANMSQDTRSILLMLPDKTGWTFNARGAEMTLEESVYFADRDVPHRTLQVVLSADTASACSVRWAFKMIAKTTTTDASQRPRFTRLPLRGGRMNDGGD